MNKQNFSLLLIISIISMVCSMLTFATAIILYVASEHASTAYEGHDFFHFFSFDNAAANDFFASIWIFVFLTTPLSALAILFGLASYGKKHRRALSLYVVAIGALPICFAIAVYIWSLT